MDLERMQVPYSWTSTNNHLTINSNMFRTPENVLYLFFRSNGVFETQSSPWWDLLVFLSLCQFLSLICQYSELEINIEKRHASPRELRHSSISSIGNGSLTVTVFSILQFLQKHRKRSIFRKMQLVMPTLNVQTLWHSCVFVCCFLSSPTRMTSVQLTKGQSWWGTHPVMLVQCDVRKLRLGPNARPIYKLNSEKFVQNFLTFLTYFSPLMTTSRQSVSSSSLETV